jgi:glycine/D-amino acid oxidase-like deaminating enzyme
MSGFAIAERCSGLRPKSADGLPIIGRFPHVENLFVATGHFRNGILLAPVTAALVSELLISNSTPPVLLRAFGPERFDSA